MITYILSDGYGSYIRFDDATKKYVPVRSDKQAHKWNNRQKAKNVLNCCLDSKLKNRFFIVEILEMDDINQKEVPIQKERIMPIKPKEEVLRKIAARPIEETQIDSLQDVINTMLESVKNVECRKNKLSSELSMVDKEIIDINHYIEFGKFNAYQAWLAFDMLRNRLMQRRKIKNELGILLKIEECKIDTKSLSDVNKSISELNSLFYTPRVLTELFE